MRKRIIAGTAALIIGASGLALIKTSEGKVNRSYLDAAGIPTICYGHTGPEVRLGQVATDAQCDAILMEDIRVHLAGVKGCTYAPLNQNQQDAIVSLAFNIGVRNYCHSTLARKLNAGDYDGAAAEFPKWNKTTINGRKVVLNGLTTRRLREQRLFLTPVRHENNSFASLKGLLG